MLSNIEVSEVLLALSKKYVLLILPLFPPLPVLLRCRTSI
nr:MAG TPA: hypothetical protein [Caudoviricetes sp.]